MPISRLTPYALGSIKQTGKLPQSYPSEAELAVAQDSWTSHFLGLPQLLSAADLPPTCPEVWNPDLFVYPFTDIERFVPKEVVKAVVRFEPPDFDLFEKARPYPVKDLWFEFKSGATFPIDLRMLRLPMCTDVERHKRAGGKEVLPEFGHHCIAELAAYLTNAARLMFCTETSEHPIFHAHHVSAVMGGGHQLGIDEWPHPNTQTIILDAATEILASTLPNIWSDAATEILEAGHMRREFYEHEGRLRQRFHRTAFIHVNELSLSNVGPLISPTTPFPGCPAHETYRDRIRRIVGGKVRTFINGFSRSLPGMDNTLDRIRSHGYGKDDAEAIAFLPDLYQSLCDVVSSEISAVEDIPLVDLRAGHASDSRRGR